MFRVLLTGVYRDNITLLIGSGGILGRTLLIIVPKWYDFVGGESRHGK
jgi:hypothetical protein